MTRIFLLALLLLVGAVRGADTPNRPNIVLILADDLGWNGVGYHGGFARTPNIDRIAREGVELDRFYAAPLCSPTRAGLLTGRHAIRSGIGRTVVRPWANYGLSPDHRTLPEALADAGYRHRAAFGKWHLGHFHPKWHPLNQGFTQYIGCYNGALDYFNRLRESEIDWHDGYNDINPKGYTTDLIADAAEQFIRARKTDDPFLCYVAFTAVHDPFQAPEEYLARYPDLQGHKRTLAAMTESMDDAIGRILKSIDETGLKQQTLIWFLSDNGGVGHIPGNNHPLRASKGTVYEGGTRVPAAAWWPGVLEGGRKVTTSLAYIDLMPTLLSLGGGKTDPARPFDGINAWDALTGKAPAPARDLFSFIGTNGLDNEDIAVTSSDGWKLIVIGPDLRRPAGIATPDHKIELFNLNDDPSEKTDLAAAHPDRVSALAKKLIAFRSSEPDNALLPMNRRPADFTPPKNWHNGPEAK